VAVRGIDFSWSTCSPGQARQLHADGYRVALLYLPPSPGWSSAVTPDWQWAIMREAGFALWGVRFGPDAMGAVPYVARYGLQGLVLDIEYGDPGGYAPFVGDTWRAAGVRCAIYGTAGAMDWGNHFDLLWEAWWVGEDRVRPLVTDRLGWQHTGATTLHGINCDLSLLPDAFLGDIGQVGGGSDTGTAITQATEDGDDMRMKIKRPDGGWDIYVLLPSGVVKHLVLDANETLLGTDDLPGRYVVHGNAHYVGTTAVYQGVAGDGGVWEVDSVAGSPWVNLRRVL
jgi:hypothetical protein